MDMGYNYMQEFNIKQCFIKLVKLEPQEDNTPRLNSQQKTDNNRQRRFPCQLCPKEYSSKYKLIYHEKDKHEEFFHQNQPENCSKKETKQYVCSECSAVFKTKCPLKNHIENVHLKIKNVSCEICNKKCYNKGALGSHLKYHFNIKNFRCKICAKGFVKKGDLTRHSLIHSDVKNFTCALCSRKFKTKHNLKQHLTNMHSEDNHKKLPCQICNKTVRIRSMEKHLNFFHNLVDKKHSCKVCGKLFHQNNNLMAHLKRHTNLKELLCNICGKKFLTQSGLSDHRYIHSDQKTFECRYCEMKFKQRSGLCRHVGDVHLRTTLLKCSICNKKVKYLREHIYSVHSSDREILSCPKCPATFKLKHEMTRHLESVHFGIKKYSCEKCDRKFYGKSNFMLHLRRHNNIKQYVCMICCKTFVSKSELNQHRNVHKVERNFSCCHCGKAFNRKSVLSRHIFNLHVNPTYFSCPICKRKIKLLKAHMKTVHSKS